MSVKEIQRALDSLSQSRNHVTPEDMDTSVNSQGQRSRIGRYRAGTALALRPESPFRVAIPAYYGDTTNGTAGDSEQFSLPHSVTDSPATESVVVWLDGDYYGSPDSVDYANDTITVTDSGTGSNLHVWYISDQSASLEVRKSVPQSTSGGSQTVYTGNLALIHETKQTEQEETLSIGTTPLHPLVGTDMTLDVYLDAPYPVRFEDPDGDGAEPTNILLTVPSIQFSGTVDGLTSAVKQDMARA